MLNNLQTSPDARRGVATASIDISQGVDHPHDLTAPFGGWIRQLHHYYHISLPLEDFFQEAAIVILGCQKAYKEGSATYKSYVMSSLKNIAHRLRTYENKDIRRANRNTVQLNEYIEHAEQPEKIELLELISKILPKTELRLIVRFFGLGGSNPETMASIAKERGVTRQGVHNKITRIIAKLRASKKLQQFSFYACTF